MTADTLLAVFSQVVDDVAAAMATQSEWGGSGQRSDQYALDVVADDLIVAALEPLGVGVLSEELGAQTPRAGTAGEGVTVVVDPVDGSTNASLGLPWFATSLCAVDDDGPWVATVANLATGHRFTAVRGQGVEVDALTRPRRRVTELGDAIVGVSGRPVVHGGWKQFRALGACALDLCSVASGGLDGYVDVDDAHGVWDYLGGALVCEEAGMVVGDALGRELCVLDHAARRAPIVASTPELFDQLRSAWPTWRA